MQINGTEYGLLYSVGAEEEIARLCPDGDLRRIGEAVKGSTAEAVATNTQLVCILSKWHEKALHFAEPTHEENPLTPELVALLPVAVFAALQREAFQTILADGRPTVEAEPGKKGAAPK